jgi:hypothetical protein
MTFSSQTCEAAAATTLSNGDPFSSKMLFVTAPQRKSRMPALGASVVVHGIVVTVLLLWSVDARPSSGALIPHKYSVRFIQLQTAPEYRRQSSPSSPAATPQFQAAAHSRASQLAAASSAAAADENARDHRLFKLPSDRRVHAVKQTLVQLDLPPDLELKQEMPLPTALLWTQTPLPAMRKRFIAPPASKAVPKVTQSMPLAPALTAPNLEVTPGDLNIASVVPAEMPHLVHPPTVASPISHTGQEPAKEIPQIGAADSAQASSANVISLPMNALRNSSLLVLPPANQIAASDVGSAGLQAGTGTGTGSVGHAAAGSGSAAGGATGSGGGAASSGGKGTDGAAGTGAAGTAGTGAAGTGATTVASAATGDAGKWSATGSAGTMSNGTLTGATRLELPKDGKFGVVVLGSTASVPYPESAGALSGKVVYTVYLKVGLRKSWILQYCLAKAAAPEGLGGRSVVPVEAPWPFLIMRPDQRSTSDPDYIIVHGKLTAEGKFEQLAMVFPEELDTKELIVKSLNLWAFRPAKRDGVPVGVEVLLIIPRQPE